jgi:hypothetical protein
MAKYNKRRTLRQNKKSRQTRKNKGTKKTTQRKILNPSGLSHIYTSVYGPRAYKGGLVPTMVI